VNLGVWVAARLADDAKTAPLSASRQCIWPSRPDICVD